MCWARVAGGVAEARVSEGIMNWGTEVAFLVLVALVVGAVLRKPLLKLYDDLYSEDE